MSSTGPLPPGCMPDFSRVHSVHSKRAAQFKSESARSLTEFREFKFTSGGSRPRSAKFNASTAAKIAQAASVQEQPPTINKATKNKENGGAHAAVAPAAKKAKTVAEPSTPRLTLTLNSALQSSKPTPTAAAGLVSCTPSRLQQPRILPPPPQSFVFAAPAPAVSALSFPTIPESPADADDSEFVPAVSASAAGAAAAAAASDAPVSDADFYSMDSCLHDILNDEAWKDDDEEGEGNDIVLPFASQPAVSTLPPCTPGRLGSAAARVLTTPRAGGAVDRASIYGGAIRTPLRTKPATPAMVKTVAARLTISGALPGASTARAAAAAAPAAVGPCASPAPATGFALSAAQRVKPAATSTLGAGAAAMATPAKAGAVIFRIAPSPAAATLMASSSLAMLPPKTPARK